jgi:hypothetical protein
MLFEQQIKRNIDFKSIVMWISVTFFKFFNVGVVVASSELTITSHQVTLCCCVKHCIYVRKPSSGERRKKKIKKTHKTPIINRNKTSVCGRRKLNKLDIFFPFPRGQQIECRLHTYQFHFK